MRQILQFFVVVLFSFSTYAEKDINPDLLAKTKKSIVTINTRVPLAAYLFPGSWNGTGFITDKKAGIVVTNSHVVGRAAVGNYIISFHNGQQAEAKLMYYDTWQDYAILKINEKELPKDIEQIEFATKKPSLNQSVFIVGNNEGQDFSYHTGNISNLYDINGEMPQHSYIVNLNSAGGSSGSPLLDNEGKAIGLHYGGSRTYGISLNGDYVKYALDAIQNGKMPNRRHIGVITELYSLEKAVKHRYFPEKKMKEYLKNYPEAKNKAIIVKSTIPGTPASQKLHAGDIIWAINDKLVAANLYEFDHAMDRANTNKVKLSIYRDGKYMDIVVDLYYVLDYQINKMVQFAGSVIIQSDDYMSSRTGVPIGKLFISTIQDGSSFSVIPEVLQADNRIYRVAPKKFGTFEVKNLEDVIKVIPELVKQKYIKMEYRNYLPYHTKFQGPLMSNHEMLIYDLTFDNIDTTPRVVTYDKVNMEWKADDINIFK